MTAIIYASQTGTAEDAAHELAIDLTKTGVKPTVLCASQVRLKTLSKLAETESMIILMIATTGEGQPPDSLFSLWQELLDASLKSDTLAGLKYSVFGFGDSKYGNLFNAMARKVDKRLSQLGAIVAVERGLGD